MVSAATSNFVLIAVIITACTVYLLSLLRGNKRTIAAGGIGTHAREVDQSRYTIEALTDHVSEQFDNIISSNLYDLALSKEEFEKKSRQIETLVESLKDASTGSLPAKIFVKEYITDILLNTYDLNDQTIDLVLPFHSPSRISTEDKFNILLHMYKKKHGYDALTVLMEENNLDALKEKENEEEPSYIVFDKEIDSIYSTKANSPLSFQDKLAIIVQLVYQNHTGYGIIDEIRNMNIDGYSAGVSGDEFPNQVESIEDELQLYTNVKSGSTSLNSVWILFKGKMVHLSFLKFKDQEEIIRICQIIYKHGNPGQLSQKEGFKTNSMADETRIVVFRPPVSESWALFGRKFDLKRAKLEELLLGKNSDKVITLIKYLMKGHIVTGITGTPGAGKTLLMIAMVKYINPTLPIRTIEAFFELYLRKQYPGRNIFGTQETPYVDGQATSDAHKKTDGKVGILGEISTDRDASWGIQNFQKTFLFALFTHHAKTTQFLINSFVNSLMKNGNFSNEESAEDQVIHALPINIHVEHEESGARYLEHITEIVPHDPDEQYEAYLKAETMEEKQDLYMKSFLKKKRYSTRRLVEYVDGEYVLGERLSDETIKQMKKKMTKKEAQEFEAFLNENWGVA